jgi:Protein of unknown function (DUF2877)
VAAPATTWPAAGSERSGFLLARTPGPATVLAVFPAALYLEVGRDLLPVVAPGGLRLPTALVLAAPVRPVGWGVQPGDVVTVGGGEVVLPGVRVPAVREWRPRRMPVAPGASASRLPSASPSTWRDDAVELAGRVVDGGPVTALVRRLVGAGPGLTPSGDDVLCGVLLGLRLLGRARDLPRLWDAVAPRLSTTTTLSAALLVEAVQGYAVPPVIELGDALVAGDVLGVSAAAAQVLAVGHTSGADLLAGLAGCLDALQDKAFVA